jgi:hypothetical protein
MTPTADAPLRARRSWLFGQWVPGDAAGGAAAGGYGQPTPAPGGYGQPALVNPEPVVQQSCMSQSMQFESISDLLQAARVIKVPLDRPVSPEHPVTMPRMATRVPMVNLDRMAKCYPISRKKSRASSVRQAPPDQWA